MKKVTVIAITGGPCAGKTVSLPLLREFLEQRGIDVITISETATQLMLSGAGYAFCGSAFEFQSIVYELQKSREDILRAEAEKHGKPVVILCDRGIPDGFAYMNKEDIPALLSGYGTTREEILARYDAVFHLVTAAVGAPDSYGRATNSARLEASAAEAVKSDRTTLEAWQGHPNLKVIDSADRFEEKLEVLKSELLKLTEQ